MTGAPAAWKGRGVEVLTGPGYGENGWWFFVGELAARNAAAECTGVGPRYVRKSAQREHPTHEGVFGAVWVEAPP